jgi:NarL family two-component system response regulator LiaR
MTIKVFVVDDHAVVRSGITALLSSESDLEVVGQAGSGKSALQPVAELKPDVILLDLEMPGMSGVEAIPKLLEQSEASRILILTSFTTDDKVFPAIKAGADGYLLKDSDPSELVVAIRDVAAGHSRLDPKIAKKVLAEIAEPANRPVTADPLTPRELDVLQLMAMGLGNAEIADELTLSLSTVRNHVSSILNKLHLANRTQAALYALRKGIASLDEPGEESS